SAWSNIAQATTQAATLPPPSSAPNPDQFEANDTTASATKLGTTNSWSQTGLTIHSTSDVDYYTFVAKSSGPFKVSLTLAQANSTLDVAVYDAQQRLLGSGASLTGNEAVSFSAVSGQSYFVKVFSPDGATNTYNLSVAKVGSNNKGVGSKAAALQPIPT